MGAGYVAGVVQRSEGLELSDELLDALAQCRRAEDVLKLDLGKYKQRPSQLEQFLSKERRGAGGFTASVSQAQFNHIRKALLSTPEIRQVSDENFRQYTVRHDSTRNCVLRLRRRIDGDYGVIESCAKLRLGNYDIAAGEGGAAVRVSLALEYEIEMDETASYNNKRP